MWSLLHYAGACLSLGPLPSSSCLDFILNRAFCTSDTWAHSFQVHCGVVLNISFLFVCSFVYINPINNYFTVPQNVPPGTPWIRPSLMLGSYLDMTYFANTELQNSIFFCLPKACVSYGLYCHKEIHTKRAMNLCNTNKKKNNSACLALGFEAPVCLVKHLKWGVKRHVIDDEVTT